jgi:hypothetical protein
MSPRYARMWRGSTKCDATRVFPVMESGVEVAAIDNALVVTRGVRDMPGFFTVRGTPDTKGRLQLLGIGLSGAPENRGMTIAVQFDGKFESDRYLGPGLFGTRKCVLSIWPADS